ncbi:hypothetical protein PROFUN_01817 [Planoprotostelium fungivorum]|uniref:Uncharacterized protein n=1 Tax=Planoprotostelium fungivorum TaxID=1890364 RepID=A0A2P6NYQ8_9EUKA|nr:hypothetical protein PROFUN_01817 [Planoprotostelium fungivorum]
MQAADRSDTVDTISAQILDAGIISNLNTETQQSMKMNETVQHWRAFDSETSRRFLFLFRSF